jgi:DNA topoisomerase IB
MPNIMVSVSKLSNKEIKGIIDNPEKSAMVVDLIYKHVSIEGNNIKFSFKGKKGVHHALNLKNKRLAKIVKACRDIPGKELFQYYNPEGEKNQLTQEW